MSDQEAVNPSDDEALKQEMEQAGDLANLLVKQNAKFVKAVSGMLASRQLYAVCVYELDSLLKDFKTVDPDGTPITDRQREMIHELLVNSAAVQAQQPFDERTLFDGLTKVIFPWLESIVEHHTHQQEEARKRAEAARLQLRINSKIDLGDMFIDAPTEGLGRTSRVLFVGDPTALRFVAAQIADKLLTAEDQQLQVVHLAEKRYGPAQPTAYLATVPPNVWADCAKNGVGFQKVYQSFVLPQINHTPDVLLVSNLLKTNTGLHTSVGAVSLANVNEAQHRLAKWCELAAALLVSFLPLDRPLRDDELNSEAWEQINRHNLVRTVTTRPADGGMVEIFTGDTRLCEVSRETLDQFKDKLIITS